MLNYQLLINKLINDKGLSIDDIASRTKSSACDIRSYAEGIAKPKKEKEALEDLFNDYGLTFNHEFRVSISTGFCGYGEDYIYYPVTMDEHIVFDIAEASYYDFSQLKDLIKILKTFDLNKYQENNININVRNYTLDVIKRIDFKNLKMTKESELRRYAYKQLRDDYDEDHELSLDDFDIMVEI